MKTVVVLLLSALCVWPVSAADAVPGTDREYDIVIYGGTAGGAIAAVQGRRMGRTVLLIEPGRHIGGLTSGGLGATDIGNKAAIGGLSREFYRRVGAYYAQAGAWKQQTAAEYRSGRQQSGESEMWTFEPHVAEAILRDMLASVDVPILFSERLDLKAGVSKADRRITAIQMESGLKIRGRMFIDATYEGDLMALAGVSYHVGREANSVYGETLNGVETQHATKHQFNKPVDPYVRPGDPASGLLPGLHPGGPGEEGAGDHRVQAYNFRMCLTDVPTNRLPFPKPEGYDPLRYELLLRYINAGVFDVINSSLPMPNRKTDTNNNGAFSTDNIGMNYDYPNGDYKTREQIFQEHVTYQQGMMWFLANDPRVPENVRAHVNRWGLCRDEFPETGGWSHQMYVREARRMISDNVMTQHHCQGRVVADDSVGMAAYTMDSHNVQRYVKDGHAINEGDVQVGGFPPYPIAYGSLVPKATECENLLVPVCLAASHIAYGSIRMEPVFMVLGQSSATAAVQALDENLPVQRISYPRLQQRLLADDQVLAWTGPRPSVGRDPAKLPGIVVDDAQAQVQGNWASSTSVGGFVGASYRHDGDAAKGDMTAKFVIPLKQAGEYEVRVAYTPNPNRATNVPVKIDHTAGTETVKLNQQKAPQQDGFQSVGKFRFQQQAVVTISNTDTDGHVIIDAVQLIPVP